MLAGDIMVANDLYQHPDIDDSTDLINLGSRQAAALCYRRFLKQVSSEFPNVLFVAGNHEFYHGKWNQTLDVLRMECGKLPNVHFMEQNTFVIDDLTFIGGTLWTDMNKSDPLTLRVVQGSMNDYHTIRVEDRNYGKLRPGDTITRHYKQLDYIRSVVDGRPDDKFVVVSHHSPSHLSTHPRYEHDVQMNGAYTSNLSGFIMDRPQIKQWYHGHTHHNFSYELGQTRICCNPRGYCGYERGSQEEDPYYPMIIEI